MLLFCMLGYAYSQQGAAADSSVPPNSFLKYSVSSVKSLVQEIAAEPDVAEHYVRLFKMSPLQLEEVFATLRIESLPKESTLEVWGVNVNEAGQSMRGRVEVVPRGERVFALPDGTPVLLKRCGNPVRKVVLVNCPSTAQHSVPRFMPHDAEINADVNSGLNSDWKAVTPDGVSTASSSVELPSASPLMPEALTVSTSHNQLLWWLLPAGLPLALVMGGGTPSPIVSRVPLDASDNGSSGRKPPSDPRAGVGLSRPGAPSTGSTGQTDAGGASDGSSAPGGSASGATASGATGSASGSSLSGNASGAAPSMVPLPETQSLVTLALLFGSGMLCLGIMRHQGKRG